MALRSTALAQLQQGDRTDEPLRVIPTRGWVLAAALTLAAGALVVWGLFGESPVTTDGVGVFTTADGIAEAESPLAGRIGSVEVAVGDRVTSGQTLAHIDAAGGEPRPLTTTQGGLVVDLEVAPGQVVDVGTPLVRIDPSGGDVAELRVALFVEPSQSSALARGQEVRLSGVGTSASSGFLRARVEEVGAQIADADDFTQLTGSESVAAQFAAAGPRIVVTVKPEVDASTPSGLSWSVGRGPESAPAVGAPATATIIRERPSPIQLVFGD